MRKLAIVLAAAFAVLVAVILTAPLLVSANFVNREVAAYLSDRTGREVRISGPVRIALLPRLKVTAEGVSLANAPGGSAEHLLEIRRAEASLRFLPLLLGRIEATDVTLDGPTLNLEIDKAGRRNWLFHKPAEAAPPSLVESGLTALPAIGRIVISDASASYFDRRSNRRQAIANIALTGVLAKRDGPLELQGSAVWNGETVKFTATAASVDMLRRGGSDAKVSLASAPLSVDFQGKIAFNQPPHVSGTISLKADSLRRALVWTKISRRPRGDDAGRLSLDGRINAGTGKIALSDATLSAGDTTARGSIAIDRRAGDAPLLSGHLEMKRLDLGALLREAPAAAPGPALIAGAVLGLPSPAAPPPPPDATPSLTALPLDLAPLAKLDADLDVAADAVRFRGFESGKTALALHLKRRRLGVEIAEMALYGGKAAGSFAIDENSGAPRLTAKLTLSAVDMQPLLLAVSDIDAVAGKGDLAIDWQATGDSESELVASLAGTGRIDLTNGTLSGAYADPANTVMVPKLENPGASRPAGKLAYTQLSASYAITHGILTNTDLKLVSPSMTATGQGFVNLPPCRVDYRWAPVIPGKGSAQVAISGPCSDLAYRMTSVTVTPPAHKKPTEPR